MDLMADMVDGLKSLRNRDTTAAETVELDTSGKDVRMLLERGINRLAESTLKSKSTLDLLVALVLVGLASSIITAETRAVILRASDDARSIAIASLIARLTDTHVKILVGEGLTDDFRNHGVNAETDLLLSLEGSIVLSSRLSLIVVLSKSERNKVLRDSGLILLNDHAADLTSAEFGVLHETSEGHVLEAEITILAGRSGGLLGGIVVRILKDGSEVSIHTVSIDGADPTMRPARSDIGAELGILEASIRRSRGRSRGGNIDILREILTVPHGARIAGRHEEDKSLEHLLASHSIKALLEIRIAEDFLSGHANDTSVTVIIVEDENVIILGGLEGLSAARSGWFTRKNIDEVLDTSVASDIILHDTFININIGTTFNIELVVDLTREGV